MKKKVGIITLYGLHNYGNRLQNYAVHKVMTNMGFRVKTYILHYDCREFKISHIIKWYIDRLTNHRLESNFDKQKADLYRALFFRSFTRKFIPTKTVKFLDKLDNKADFFVLGSDQVWNPTWYRFQDQKLYLLDFTTPKKKICFSPSFGLEELPQQWHEFFQNGLKTFPSLNVREEVGKSIIQDLIGVDAQITIDPTLMLSDKQWRQLGKKPRSVDTKKPYILTCFLGERTQECENDIKAIIDFHKASVLHLCDNNYTDLFICGPREFLYLIDKADIILTDSFHACIFSFLFKKPFIAYERFDSGPKLTSRLFTLLNLFGLTNRFRTLMQDKDLTEKIFECDYEEGLQRVSIEKDKLSNILFYLTHRKDC